MMKKEKMQERRGRGEELRSRRDVEEYFTVSKD